MLAGNQIFKQLLNAHCSPHLPDLVKAAIDDHSHGLIEYEAQTKFVFFRGETVVQYLYQRARTGCLDLGRVLFEEGMNVLADTHHGL
jgi:hypothetical protein